MSFTLGGISVLGRQPPIRQPQRLALASILGRIGAHPNIILNIEDDGIGFDVEARERQAHKEKRMGLRSMAERVGLINGTMKIHSKPSKGTHVLIKFPYQKEKNA